MAGQPSAGFSNFGAPVTATGALILSTKGSRGSLKQHGADVTTGSFSLYHSHCAGRGEGRRYHLLQRG